MADVLELLYCPGCRHEVFAEIPPCADGHDDACPDRVCVDCGTALFFDAPLFDLMASRFEPSAAAPQGTHAA